MIDVIDHAQTVIYAVIPDPSPDTMRALLYAKGRGVHMGIITSPNDRIERRLQRFGVHFWIGTTNTPFVSVDGERVFVYGQTVELAKEADRYALRFLDHVLGVSPDDDGNREASPALNCGSAWICSHTGR